MDINVPNEILERIAAFNRANPYVDIIPYELKMGLPIVHYTGFFPQPDEIIIFATPAYTFVDKNRIIGYTGRSKGISVRVAKGITLRTGGSASKPIRGSVRNHNQGDLVITSKRIIFIGKDDSFDYAINKLSGAKLLDTESFLIQSGKSSKNIQVDPVVLAYAFGILTYIRETPIDEIKTLYDNVNSFTPDQLTYLDIIRQKCSEISIPDANSKGCTGCLWALAKFLFILTAIIAIFGIFVPLMATQR